MKVIYAFDPGRTTGYAISIVDQHGFYMAYNEAKMDHKDLWHFLPFYTNHIICEKFEFRQGKTGVDLYACELIGIIQLKAAIYRAELHMQEPAIQSTKNKAAYYSDAKLKELGYYLATPHHGRSAVKHLLYWFKFGAGMGIVGEATPELVDVKWITQKMRIR